MYCSDHEAFKRTLVLHGYIVHDAKDAAEAREIGLSLIGSGSTGFGGSVTVMDALKMYDALSAQGNPVYSHWRCAPEERTSATDMAAKADFYLCSCNALTRDGKLINIDGTGNRVYGMLAGNKTTIIFAGKNKLAENAEVGMHRIKTIACPANARRLGLDTLPCSITGKCADCSNPNRMCRVTSIIEYPPRVLKALHIVLIDEELGY